MGMNSSAHAYELAQSYERRKMQVLDGKQARVREDAKRGDVVRITLAVVTLFMFLLGMTFMSAKIYSTDAKINGLHAQISDTKDKIGQIELELAQLSSLDRVETYAVANLGMVYPGADDFYFLDEQSALIIAQGERDMQMVSAETNVESGDSTMWQSIVDGISNFFVGSASASGY